MWKEAAKELAVAALVFLAGTGLYTLLCFAAGRPVVWR